MNLVKGHYSDGKIQVPGGSEYIPEESQKKAILTQIGNDKDLILGFRPEAVRVVEKKRIAAEVFLTEMNGSNVLLDLHVGEKDIVRARINRGVKHQIGSKIFFDLDPQMVRFFNPATEAALVME
jgi:ABC-type sugar transport system ATPase subunit